MNGRIYDPELGRMLSPDPFVQVPENSQNFNRYSYVLNNPVNLTDPSGFSWVSKVFDKIGNWFSENWRTVVSIVVAVVAWYAAPYVYGALGATSLAATGASATATSLAAQGALAGAVSGGFNAGINGGNFGDVLRGALIGGIQGGISGGVLHGWGEAAQQAGFFSPESALHITGHGVVGGAANEAMGGKFQDGFLSAAVSAGAAGAGFLEGGVVSRVVKAGIIGGTASVLGGGKFANGAFTAAFQHLTNEVGAISREQAIAYFENSQGEKLSWMAKLFFKHETIASVAENSSQAVMGFADGATGGIHSIAREAIYGDSYSDTGSGYYWGGVAGGAVTAAATGASASVATRSGFFWGGAGSTATAAEAAAIASSSRTLGMTVGGRALASIESTLIKLGASPATTYNFLWKPGSALFAANTRSFGGMLGGGGQIWRTIEKPILQFRRLIP